MKLNRQV